MKESINRPMGDGFWGTV